jgi:hypothetical protein
MKRIVLLSLLFISIMHCAEKALRSVDIPGSLIPNPHRDSSPMGELKLLLKDSCVHGSREDDLLRSLSKNAKEHYYEAQATYREVKEQNKFINKKFDLTQDQIKYLKDKKKKLKPEEKESLAQVEIDLLMHHLDACSLHMALMIIQGISIYNP